MKCQGVCSGKWCEMRHPNLMGNTLKQNAGNAPWIPCQALRKEKIEVGWQTDVQGASKALASDLETLSSVYRINRRFANAKTAWGFGFSCWSEYLFRCCKSWPFVISKRPAVYRNLCTITGRNCMCCWIGWFGGNHGTLGLYFANTIHIEPPPASPSFDALVAIDTQ